MPRTTEPNYYELLGLTQGASTEEVKTAWRRAAKTLHPDSPGGNAAMFVLANTAYETLSDPWRRSEYDRQLAGPRPDETAFPGWGDGWEPSDPQTSHPGGPEGGIDWEPVRSHHGWCRQVYDKPPQPNRTPLAETAAFYGWMILSTIFALRNLAWFLQTHQTMHALPRLGLALAVGAASEVVFYLLGKTIGRLGWVNRAVIVTLALTFPVVVWSPAIILGVWACYWAMRTMLWPPPLSLLRRAAWRARHRQTQAR